MRKVEELSKQHKMLEEIVNSLRAELNIHNVKENSSNIINHLANFAGKLKMHLQSEDEFLYPQLKNSSDARIRETSEKFVKEMGSISKLFMAYYDKWKVKSNLIAEPNIFIDETNNILNILGKRIMKEEKLLFPLIRE